MVGGIKAASLTLVLLFLWPHHVLAYKKKVAQAGMTYLL